MWTAYDELKIEPVYRYIGEFASEMGGTGARKAVAPQACRGSRPQRRTVPGYAAEFASYGAVRQNRGSDLAVLVAGISPTASDSDQ